MARILILGHVLPTLSMNELLIPALLLLVLLLVLLLLHVGHTERETISLRTVLELRLLIMHERHVLHRHALHRRKPESTRSKDRRERGIHTGSHGHGAGLDGRGGHVVVKAVHVG